MSLKQKVLTHIEYGKQTIGAQDDVNRYLETREKNVRICKFKNLSMQLPLLKEKFESICSNNVKSVSPFKIWKSLDLINFLEYQISHDINWYVEQNMIRDYRLKIDRIGQTYFRINIKYVYGWCNVPVQFTIIKAKLTRLESQFRLFSGVISALQIMNDRNKTAMKLISNLN